MIGPALRAQWQGLAVLLFVAHLPIAVLEGMVLGTQDRLMRPYSVATLGLD